MQRPLFSLCAALGVMTAVAGTARADDGVTATEVRIGMVNAQTGPAAGLGKGLRAGAEAVFNDVNAKGGVHGRKLVLTASDDGYEPERTVDETLKLIDQQKVFALFGYVGTPTSNAVIPIVKEYDVPLVGAFTGAMSLRAPITRQIFNLRASYDDEAETLVAQFVEKGAKSIGVFYQDDGFGLAVLSGTEKALKKRGMTVAVKGTFARNTLAIKTGLAALIEAKPDAVVMVGPYAPIAAFIKEARANGLKSMLGTVSFVGTDNLVGEVGKDGEGVYVSQVVPFPQNADVAATKTCRDLLTAAGGTLGFVNFEGCLTARLLVDALQIAGKSLTRAALIDALNGMKGHDLGGLTVMLGPDRHQALDKVFLTQIREGKIAQVR